MLATIRISGLWLVCTGLALGLAGGTIPVAASPGTSDPPPESTIPEPTDSSAPVNTTGNDPSGPLTTILEPAPPNSSPDVPQPEATEVQGLVGEPSAPTNLTFERGIYELTFNWNAPTDTGTSPVTHYRVQYRTYPDGEWSSPDGHEWPSYFVGGLNAGVTYEFRVAAVNASGPGAYASMTAVPGAPPWSASFYWVGLGDRSVQMNLINNPGPGAPTTEYLLERALSSEGPWTDLVTLPANENSYTDSGLTPGTEYFYRVRARNMFGISDADTASATAITYASAPLNPAASPGGKSAVVRWSPPADLGGGTLWRYVIEQTIGSSDAWTQVGWVPPGATEFIATGLQGGTTYRFRIAAVNGIGAGAFSAAVAVTPVALSAPSAPRSVAMPTWHFGPIDVTWQAPTSDGGAPIAGYIVYHSNDGTNWTAANLGPTARSFTIPGQTPTTTYHAVVYAFNTAGYFSPQSNLASATTHSVSVPQSVAMTASPGSVNVTWHVPVWNGGAPIGGYIMYHSNDGTNWTATNLGPTTTSLTLSGLNPGTTYHAVVYAYNVAGYFSPQSNLASATTTA